jgi:hypothetical protein
MNMPGIGSVSNKLIRMGWLALLLVAGCNRFGASEPVRSLQVQQNWELQPGDTVAGYRIAGSLGDVSVELNGGTVYAPFDGKVQPNDIQGCLIYSSPEIPAYLFRLCGLRSPKLGDVKQGDAIGNGNYLQFAALRRQPEGTWAIVEPASDILERALQKP